MAAGNGVVDLHGGVFFTDFWSEDFQYVIHDLLQVDPGEFDFGLVEFRIGEEVADEAAHCFGRTGDAGEVFV